MEQLVEVDAENRKPVQGQHTALRHLSLTANKPGLAYGLSCGAFFFTFLLCIAL